MSFRLCLPFLLLNHCFFLEIYLYIFSGVCMYIFWCYREKGDFAKTRMFRRWPQGCPLTFLLLPQLLLSDFFIVHYCNRNFYYYCSLLLIAVLCRPNIFNLALTSRVKIYLVFKDYEVYLADTLFFLSLIWGVVTFSYSAFSSNYLFSIVPCFA